MSEPTVDSSADNPVGEQSSVPRRRSLRKRLLFASIVLVLALAMLELLARVGIHFAGNDLQNLRSRQDRIVGLQADETPNEAFHPYLGWVANPEAPQSRPVNRLGFHAGAKVLGKRRPGTLRIAIVGGSVARQLAESSATTIVKELNGRPAFRDVDVQIVPLAMSGYKQPQQLLQVGYLLSLGAEFDAVVNIDGYNEVALHRDENAEAQVFYAYPRAWHGRLVGVMDPVRVERTFRMIELKVARIRLAKWIRSRPYRYSALLNAYWSWRDDSLKRAWMQHQFDVITMRRRDGLGYHVTGPGSMNASGTKSFEQLADLWMHSSLQLHRLCNANGAAYLHFLQPSQYVAGSKPFSKIELTDYIEAGQGYGKSAARGYPLLSDRGRKLVASGVGFHDLTRVFSNTPETVYSDRFCHLNALGNETLAARVVDDLTRVLQPKTATGQRDGSE